MQDEIRKNIYKPEIRQKIGAVTYIVAAHFDNSKESLPEKIKRLVCLEFESEITHLRKNS